MAHSLSAKKRVRQNAKRRAINRARKSVVKTQIKHLGTAIDAGDTDKAKDQLRDLTRKLDQFSTTSTMHKNTAARIKSRMTRRVNALAARAAD
ncbi:MAG: 30S ribosomal protein S20 [Planctomycetota bacterium]|nr:MAG: 30S ribosomal protein S20 [Planctomycetota bacterium]RKY12885.1 MAG: 30S ribosomal protein S20 [Planctomycetota bacterium]